MKLGREEAVRQLRVTGNPEGSRPRSFFSWDGVQHNIVSRAEDGSPVVQS